MPRSTVRFELPRHSASSKSWIEHLTGRDDRGLIQVRPGRLILEIHYTEMTSERWRNFPQMQLLFIHTSLASGYRRRKSPSIPGGEGVGCTGHDQAPFCPPLITAAMRTSMDHTHCSQRNTGAVTIIFGTVHGSPAHTQQLQYEHY